MDNKSQQLQDSNQIEYYQKKIEELTLKNISRFNIELNSQKTSKTLQNTEKKEKTDLNFDNLYSKMRLKEQNQKQFYKKMQFKNGSYCYYTEFIPNQPEFTLPIITIQGSPQFTYEWQHIEQNSQTRWINYLQPGLDSEDERRGEVFKGTLNEQTQMLNDFMENLNIPKAIFFVHSFGTIIYNVFSQQFPHRIAAVGLFGAFGLKWHTLTVMSKGFITNYIENEYPNQKFNVNMLNDERVRENFRNKIKNVILKNFDEFEFFHFCKIVMDDQITDDNFFEKYKKQSHKQLKFLCQGNKDLFIDKYITDQTYHYYTYDNPYKNKLQLFQIQFLQRQYPKYSNFTKLNLQNLQENFVFQIDGGHDIHNKSGKYMIKAINSFQSVVESLNFSQPKL